MFLVISCTGHLRKNTLDTVKQHSEKAVDYIGVCIANQKIKNLKFFLPLIDLSKFEIIQKIYLIYIYGHSLFSTPL